MAKTNSLVKVPLAKHGMPPALAEHVSPEGWATFCNILYPDVKDPIAIEMAISYSRANELDPIRKPVEIVPYAGKYKLFLSINGLRALARRGGYCGSKEPIFGDEKEFKIGGTTIKAPEFCQYIVLDGKSGKPQEFYGSRVYYEEFVQTTKDGAPNSNWKKKPRMMLQKCAEAAALRAAFPEVGAHYDQEEISGYDVPADEDEGTEQIQEVETLEATIIDEPEVAVEEPEETGEVL